MKHRITITSDRHDEPDLDRIVACLLALAMARLEAEKQAAAAEPPASNPEAADA